VCSTQEKKIMQTECTECGAVLDVPADVMQGEILPCADCGAELEVISVEPLELEPAPLEMEDWGE
jgi:alpha-aminoadipate/glutamate carrier protein LysW